MIRNTCTEEFLIKRTFRPKIVNAASHVEDAGMILEVFQDAVDEIKIPEGYNWDYKIYQLENGEPAGQIFIMTDDDQPVAFFTFALTKDGESLDIVNDRKLYTNLVNELKSEVKNLGDMSEFISNPKQETIVLSSTIVDSPKTQSISANSDVDMPDTVAQQDLEDRMLYTCIAMKHAVEDAEAQISVADIDEFSYKLVQVRKYIDQLEDMLQTWYTHF